MRRRGKHPDASSCMPFAKFITDKVARVVGDWYSREGLSRIRARNVGYGVGAELSRSGPVKQLAVLMTFACSRCNLVNCAELVVVE